MGMKKKIFKILSRRWLRSNCNGLCIITFISIFLYVIYFVSFYFVYIKKNSENEMESESEDVVLVEDRITSFYRFFPVITSSKETTKSYNLADRDTIREYLNKILKDNLKLEKGSICEPRQDEKPKEKQQTMRKLVCTSLDWVQCYKSECKVVKDIQETTENIKCIYKDVHYKISGEYILGNSTLLSNNMTYVLKDSDYVAINCSGNDLYGSFPTSWRGIGVGIRKKNETKDEGEGNGSVNILLLGFGCDTRIEFKKKLPKTYKILKKLNANVLNGFTSLGEEFTSTLFPMLTGKNELEFYDVRKSISSFEMQSDWFIFKLLEKIGYSTAFYTDSPSIMSRLNRFNQRPAKHYNHPFLTHLFKRKQMPCLGDSSVYEMFMDLTLQLLNSSSKSFAFTLMSSACGRVGSIVDDAAQKMLENLEGRNNTLIIVFGTRGGASKQTNNDPPFAAIILPLKFRPGVQTSLKGNINAVTTPYDVYATLLDAVNLTEYWNKERVDGSQFFRGMSVLRPIPLNRTCSDAAVLPEWCSCSIYDVVTKTDNLHMTLAQAFVSYINILTAPVRTRCASHYLYAINWMKKQRINMKLITYEGSVDQDGYIARFNPTKRNPKDHYIMQLVISPSGATFEANVTYYNGNGKIEFDENIVRINDNITYCILPTHPHLIKYCYCK